MSQSAQVSSRHPQGTLLILLAFIVAVGLVQRGHLRTDTELCRAIVFRRDMRDYLFDQNPLWIAGVIYVHNKKRAQRLTTIFSEKWKIPAWLQVEPLARPGLVNTPHYHRLLCERRANLETQAYLHSIVGIWACTEL